MGFFFTLLFGVLFAVAWQRIGRLDRRIAALTSEVEGLRYALVSRPQEPGPQDTAQAQPEPDDAAVATAPAPPVAETPPEPQLSMAKAAAVPAVTADLAAASVSVLEPAPAAASAPEAETYDEPAHGFSFDFEDIFGRRLPIWGGGFALAIAGIFLVRFSIEAGLLTPSVRVVMSFLFGLALLAGAETAYRFAERLADPRVRQALAGAGLATLYGAFYLAGTTYGLIGAGTAFVGLAAVTAAAIALSFRFGLPSAVIGLVGGFAAPLLVDSDSANVPLLSFYLALITGGLAWSGQAQGRPSPALRLARHS